MAHGRSAQYPVEQRTEVEGDLDATDPEGAGAADAGILGHGLVGLDIEDITLLEVVIGRVEEVGIAEV